MCVELKEITDSNFREEVIENKGVVLVDFYAEWCQPCKILDKTIKELNNELNGKAKICKADVETNSNTVTDLGISGVPALLIFKNGKLINRNVGLRSKQNLQHDLEKAYNE